MQVLDWLVSVFKQAFWPSLETTFGLNPITAGCAVLSILVFAYIKIRIEGRDAMKVHWSDTWKLLLAGIVAWFPFYIATTVVTVYRNQSGSHGE